MTFRSNKRLGVFLSVFALLIIAGGTAFFVNSANLRGIAPSQLTAESGAFDVGQQVKVLSGYAASVVLYPLVAGEQQKDILFCNLKPDGSPAYPPTAYKARMDKNAKCLSGHMEDTKLQRQREVILGNLGTVESILAAIGMTKTEMGENRDYGFSLRVIPSGSFLPVPVQYASSIQMKCVVNAIGGKSPEGIGTITSLNEPGYYLKTSASVAKFYAIEKKIAAILKSVEDLMAGTMNALEKVLAYGAIMKNAIGLKGEAVAAGIPLSPAAVQKYYRSILASGPSAVVGLGFNRDENGQLVREFIGVNGERNVCAGTSSVGSVGVEVGRQSFSFTNICMSPDDFNQVGESLNKSEQRFKTMKASLGTQLNTNDAARKKLEANNYNCN